MTRVALMPSAYLPSLGGVQELTRHLALSLVSAGDDVEIWVQRDDAGTEPAIERLDGLVVRRFPLRLPGSAPASWTPFARAGWQSMRSMRAAMRSFAPDVLHVQCFGPNGAYAAALSRLSSTPLVVSLQGETVMDDADVYEHSATLRTSLRLGLRQAAAVTACSQFTLDDSEHRFGLAAGRGKVIFNGVELGDAVPPSDAILSGDAAPAGGVDPATTAAPERVVLALGRVVAKKGFDLLLRAFAVVAHRHPDVMVHIGGTGDAESALRDLAAKLGIADQVRLLGRLSREDVAAAMAQAEIFVMPSRLEPFGIVVLEAWRAGRATIATSHGGPPEYVHDGVDGLLVDPFDTDAFAAALDRLLDDPASGAALGRAAEVRVRDFAWDRIAEQYREVYRQVCTGVGAPRGR